MKLHFDALFDRKVMQSLETKLRGRTLSARIKLIEQGLGRLVQQAPTSANPGVQLTAFPCYALWWTLLHSQGRHFREMRKDGPWLRMLSLFGGAEETINTNARLFYHAARYLQHGSRTFEVSSNLGTVLRNTELQGLVGSDLQLPYRSIYIDAPLDTGLQVWNQETQWHRLAGIYLMIEDGQDTETKLPIAAGRTLRALIIGEWTMKEVACGFSMPDDALLYWAIPLIDDWPLAKCVKHHKDFARNYMGETPRPYRKMAGQWDDIFTWMINVVMYATSQDARADFKRFDPRADVLRRKLSAARSTKNRKKTAAELNQLDQRRYTVLGHGMPSPLAEPGTGTPLEHRVLVSGHWRNQACGPQWSERKTILIEPYWKGPEDAEESHVTHRLV